MKKEKKMINDKVKFKRVARFEGEPGKHIALSLASNNSYTLTQFMYTVYRDGTVANIPLPGAIRFTKDALYGFFDMLVWTLLRIPKSEIPEEYREFVEELRSISVETIEDFEDHMMKIGFPATEYRGQSFIQYPQQEEESTKNRPQW
jgi:hypothetical protein